MPIYRNADCWFVARANTEAARKAASKTVDDPAVKLANQKLAQRIVAPLSADQMQATLAANPDLEAALEGKFGGALDPNAVRIVTPQSVERFHGVDVETARHAHQQEQRKLDQQFAAAREVNKGVAHSMRGRNFDNSKN